MAAIAPVAAVRSATARPEIHRHTGRKAPRRHPAHPLMAQRRRWLDSNPAAMTGSCWATCSDVAARRAKPSWSSNRWRVRSTRPQHQDIEIHPATMPRRTPHPTPGRKHSPSRRQRRKNNRQGKASIRSWMHSCWAECSLSLLVSSLGCSSVRAARGYSERRAMHPTPTIASENEHGNP